MSTCLRASYLKWNALESAVRKASTLHSLQSTVYSLLSIQSCSKVDLT